MGRIIRTRPAKATFPDIGTVSSRVWKKSAGRRSAVSNAWKIRVRSAFADRHLNQPDFPPEEIRSRDSTTDRSPARFPSSVRHAPDWNSTIGLLLRAACSRLLSAGRTKALPAVPPYKPRSHFSTGHHRPPDNGSDRHFTKPSASVHLPEPEPAVHPGRSIRQSTGSVRFCRLSRASRSAVWHHVLDRHCEPSTPLICIIESANIQTD